jgi:hypothetical protein
MMPVNIGTLSQAKSSQQSLARHGLGAGLDIGRLMEAYWRDQLETQPGCITSMTPGL